MLNYYKDTVLDIIEILAISQGEICLEFGGLTLELNHDPYLFSLDKIKFIIVKVCWYKLI